MKAFMACIFVLAMMTWTVIEPVEATISCGTVTTKLTPCINYLKKGGVIPAGCCAGIQSLNMMAHSIPDRRQICHCLSSAAQKIEGLKPNLAAALPRACSVHVPYPISFDTNCDKSLDISISSTSL